MNFAESRVMADIAEHGPRTSAEMQQATGMHINRVRAAIKSLSLDGMITRQSIGDPHRWTFTHGGSMYAASVPGRARLDVPALARG